MRSIFIATPSYHTPVSAYYASMLATIPALERAGHLVIWREWEQCCYVHTARNKLTAEFLVSGCDDILMIDNDLGWKSMDILRLASRTEDVVGAAAPFRHGEHGFPVHPVTDDHGRPRMDPASGLLEVDVLPTAIMKITRDALMRIAKAGHAPLRIEYGRNRQELGRYLSFFDFEVDDTEHLEFGEDVTFCRKWHRVGGKLLVDPDFTITHFGPNFRVGNLREHLKLSNIASVAA